MDFFPDRLENCCKIRGLNDYRLFFAVCFGGKFWRDFGERKKLNKFKILKALHLLNKKVELE